MQNLRDAVINLSKEETRPWFLAKESNVATLTYNLEVQTKNVTQFKSQQAFSQGNFSKIFNFDRTNWHQSGKNCNEKIG